ncbi:MAG: 2-oxoacid:acceptor oxidoreductase family protein [Euryarchaeota archaeon]|nr:2-oxoacid:acceptor oxidoreductase family protein [Euryarchaeota archaeon]MCD6158616.1 2-oxoacid:acceptor oxidoreductase family protein [Euryarchaeota archaeon]RLF66241.1 MAG: pyruvate synthase [Thermoplasmata archaeon]
MEDVFIEVRWHGRGGQGVVTAGRLAAETALLQGYYVQSFPEFGPERAGAPVRAYTRISNKPIRIHYQVLSPDYVVILDPTLIGNPDLKAGLKETTKVIINAPEELYENVRSFFEGYETYVVDATKISIDVFGRNLPNTPMVAAFFKISGVVDRENFEKTVLSWFEERLGKDLAEKNVEVARRTWDEVKKLE